MMVFKEHFLPRRDILKESSNFSIRVSSAMRRLYLRSCEKLYFLCTLASGYNASAKRPHSQWVFYTVLGRVLVCSNVDFFCLGRISRGWSVQR